MRDVCSRHRPPARSRTGATPDRGRFVTVRRHRGLGGLLPLTAKVGTARLLRFRRKRGAAKAKGHVRPNSLSRAWVGVESCFRLAACTRRTSSRRISGYRGRVTIVICRLATIRRLSIASSAISAPRKRGSGIRGCGSSASRISTRPRYCRGPRKIIPRRFCSGTAVINDGERHAIFYSIAEDDGLVGKDWGVSFCVVGLDRSLAYGPACRAARP